MDKSAPFLPPLRIIARLSHAIRNLTPPPFACRRQGSRVVLAFGCFSVFHPPRSAQRTSPISRLGQYASLFLYARTRPCMSSELNIPPLSGSRATTNFSDFQHLAFAPYSMSRSGFLSLFLSCFSLSQLALVFSPAYHLVL